MCELDLLAYPEMWKSNIIIVYMLSNPSSFCFLSVQEVDSPKLQAL